MDLTNLLSEEKDEYAELPEPIKMLYTRREYLWLSDAEKGRLIQTECEPDEFSD